MRKASFIPGLASVGFFILAIPVGLAIIVTIWLTAAAAYENVKFVRCNDQLLTIISMARDDAATDSDFGARAGEDLVDDLMRRAQLLNLPVNNWGGAVRAVMETPPLIRVETDVPVRACRRLALFFGKDASALKLVKIEAHEEKSNWIIIYDDSNTNAATFDYRLINTACGWGNYSTFAVTLRLR